MSTDSLARVRNFLAEVRAHLRRHDRARVVLWALAALLVLALIVPFAALLLIGPRTTALALIAGAGLIAFLILVTTIVLGAVVPARRWRSDTAVARWVGERARPVASDLLSTVELTGDRAGRRGAPSATLLGALVDGTAVQVATLTPVRLVPTQPVRQAMLACLAVIAVHAAVASLIPEHLGRGWHRLVIAPPQPFGGAELSPVPLVGDVRITLEFPAYTRRPEMVLPSSSGDFRAMPGTVVTIETTALTPAIAANILVERADAGDAAAAGRKAAARSDELDVTAPTMIAMTVDGSQLRAQLVVDGGGRWRVELTAPDRRRRVEATPHVIELEPDLAPVVQLYTPGDDLDVTDTRRVELAYVAEDDYGVARAELVWTTGDPAACAPAAKPAPADDAADAEPDGEAGEPRGPRVAATPGTPGPQAATPPAAAGPSPMGPTLPVRRCERKALALAEGTGARAQGKLVWDLAEIDLPPGATVTYHLEAGDNDAVRGPNVGRSREYRLRVFSPRERHEQNLARLQELAEKVLGLLGGRLTLPADDLAARDGLNRQTDELVVETGTLLTALGGDPMADKALAKALGAMRDRVDKLATSEGKLLPKAARGAAAPGTVVKGAGARFAATDKALIAELEDDVIALADWVDREQMEALLDVADEIAGHQKRLQELLDQYAKSGDPKLKAEIAREIRALEQRLAELAQKRGGMAADVLDQFVNADAMAEQRADSCMREVQRLIDADQVAAAQAKLAECTRTLDDAAAAMEGALGELRGDRFSDEEKKLGELMDELADVARDQADIAAEADRLFERYADRADELMRDLGKEAQRKLGSTLERLRDRLDAIPESGLTPFAKEELDVVRRRLDDLDHMLEDGDIAEALGMARQAQSSLDTVTAELEAAIDDDPKSPWAEDTARALEAVERAHPPAGKLVGELEALAPSPDDIMSDDDKKALDKLRRRQAATHDRAERLAGKGEAAKGQLPGDAAGELTRRVGEATGKMALAEDRMKRRDPSGARQEARSAAEALEKARKQAQGAARQRQLDGGSIADEPIRIPGADEYRAPEKFREELLEAMKKRAPAGYDDLVKRYYEELIR